LIVGFITKSRDDLSSQWLVMTHQSLRSTIAIVDCKAFASTYRRDDTLAASDSSCDTNNDCHYFVAILTIVNSTLSVVALTLM
jgi:hypothetical protein